jgi:hypothetical protein
MSIFFLRPAFGVMSGMGRAVSAAFGAALVTFSITGQKPQRWALVVALLYFLAARPHYHWVDTPTNLGRLSQSADLLWPSVVCLSVPAMIGSMRGRHSMTARSETPGPSS